jgi:hypothetical protein
MTVLAFQCAVPGSEAPQHFLYFLPLPHGHGSLRPTFGSGRTYVRESLADSGASSDNSSNSTSDALRVALVSDEEWLEMRHL